MRDKGAPEVHRMRKVIVAVPHMMCSRKIGRTDQQANEKGKIEAGTDIKG